MSTPAPIGYTAALHVPVIGPPPAGADPEAHYAAVLAATTVAATPVANSAMEISVSNPAHAGLFAMTGGFATFVPPGQPLPTQGAEPAPGAGAVHLQSWAADVLQMRKALPAGVPPMLDVLYLDVPPAGFRAAVDPLVRALPEAELRAGWNLPTPAASRTDLENNYLDRVERGELKVFVAAGAALGQAAPRGTGAGFTLRFLDRAGSDLSPVLHLRGMPSLDAKRWKGHPLAALMANVVVPVDVYLRFEVWESGDTYLPLPAGVPVELVDHNPVLADRVLATQNTDAQGRVHFAIPNLGALGEAQPDLYFRVRTAGRSHAGHTLPAEWSTKGWRATDGSAGYYENFAGTRLGDAANPLNFRIGVDFHARLAYPHGEIGPRVAGSTVTVAPGSRDVQGYAVISFDPISGRPVSSSWSVLRPGMLFRVAGDRATYRITAVNPGWVPGSTTTTTPTLTLDRAYAGPAGSGKKWHLYHPAPPRIPVALFAMPTGGVRGPEVPGQAAGHKKADLLTDAAGEVHGIVFDVSPERSLYFDVRFESEDPSIRLRRATMRMDQPSWKTSYADADRVDFPANAEPSLGAATRPVLLLATDQKRDVALNVLKCLREMHGTLFHLTGGAWPGTELSIGLWAPDRSFSWPVGSIAIADDAHWERGTIMHEISHQLMWKEVGFSSLGIVYEQLLGDFTMWHRDDLYYSRELAFMEGWGAFVEEIFQTHRGDSPPFNAMVRGPVTFAHGVASVTSPQYWNQQPNLSSLHVEGENTWYSVTGWTPGSQPTRLNLDRPYEGTHGIGKPSWVMMSVEDKPAGGARRRLLPHPPGAIDGEGEKVEGAFANGLWRVFERLVVGRGTRPHVDETVNGDATQTAPWITSTAIRDRFLRMIWDPFRALKAIPEPDSAKMFAQMRALNAADWHVIHAELQPFNLAPAAPTISSVAPASGPAAGGQRVTITGANFVAGADVFFGAAPAANVSVTSSTTLEADTPPGAAGPVDVAVRTLSGRATRAGGYTYT